MNSDKMDIDQHIEFNQSGMDKLNKMTDKLNEVLGKQGGSRKQQAKTIASMIE